jgi:5-deoxy-glucuronate isomerase
MSGPAKANTSLHRRPVAAPAGGAVHSIDATDAGWDYVGFHEYRLTPTTVISRSADDREVVLVVLEGHARVQAGGVDYGRLGSRDRVFDGPAPPVLLLEPGLDLHVCADDDATIVVADAPAASLQETRLIRPDQIRIETRGSGDTERRIHHLLPPSERAGRLILFEVFTPGGNWSSYPPHKHDTEDPPTEAYLEELYYYRYARPEGWGFARVYTPDRTLDESFATTDGDVVLVPRGYHPFGAPAGYDAYYLNVMAGPNRAWHFTVDPDHRWLMDWDPDRPS